MRIPLIAAAVALTSAIPANAAAGPVCHAALANAATGASRACTTYSVGETDSSGSFTRTLTLEVASGAATATLHCFTYYRSWTGTLTVTGPGVDYLATSDDERCDVTLTATASGTTATATSTFAWRPHWQ